MKEGKNKKPAAKKKTNNKKPSHNSSNKNMNSKPAVKDTKKSRPVDADFKDVDDDGDKRLIVFIAAAVLVIVGTVIGLLVGLQNKKEEEPKKPDDNTNIVIPQKPDEKKDEDIVYGDVEKPLPVVRKVTQKVESKDSSSSSSNSNEEEEQGIGDSSYYVTYYVDGDEEEFEVNPGSTIGDNTPTGYENCTYYSDENHENELSSDTEVTGDMDVYAVCSLITYTIEYPSDVETDNPTEFNKNSNVVALSNPTGTTRPGNFAGWFLDSNYSEEITEIDPSKLMDYADSSNKVTIYAKYTTGVEAKFYNEDGGLISSKEVEPGLSVELLEESDSYCLDGNSFAYWDSSENKYAGGDNVTIEENTDFRAVCVAVDPTAGDGDDVIGGVDGSNGTDDTLITPATNDTLLGTMNPDDNSSDEEGNPEEDKDLLGDTLSQNNEQESQNLLIENKENESQGEKEGEPLIPQSNQEENDDQEEMVQNNNEEKQDVQKEEILSEEPSKNEEVVKEEIKSEEPKKEEPNKEEPKKEEPVIKEEPKEPEVESVSEEE